MGVLFAGMLFGGIAGTVVGLSVAWIAARFGMSKLGRVSGMCVGVLVALLSVGPSVQWVISETTRTHVGMAPDEAESLAATIGLRPNTFRDFCYHRSLVGGRTVADFSMEETDFLEWARSRDDFDLGRYEKSVDPSNTIAVAIVDPVRSLDPPKRSLEIFRGYCWFWDNPDRGDNTVSLAYDLDSGRAYYSETNR